MLCIVTFERGRFDNQAKRVSIWYVALCHVVGGSIVKPQGDEITVVNKLSLLFNKIQVRAFLGIAFYYRKFCQIMYVSAVTPLTDLTKKSAPNKV